MKEGFNKTIKSYEWYNYFYIVVGSFLLSLGMVGFLAPNNIATGGTAGLAIIFHSLVSLPIGLLMGLINVPLLLVSIKYLGKLFAFKSITSIVLISVFVDVLGEYIQLPTLSTEPLLATLYGGIAVGLGLGLIFKGGGSAGGGTIIAKIIISKFDIKTGTVILMLDSIVVASAGIVFQSIELALWSMISIFASSKLIDLVITGKPTQKIVHISSLCNLEVLSKNIIEVLGVTGTIVEGSDLDLNEQKHIIFIVVDRNRISALSNLVHTYDPNARMIVMEANEMLGVNARK